jgi:hypothetical protein
MNAPVGDMLLHARKDPDRYCGAPSPGQYGFGMTTYLREKPHANGSRAICADLAETIDAIRRPIEDASSAVERALTRWAKDARKPSRGGITIRKLTSHPSAAHTGAMHPHELLCAKPAMACAALQGVARFVRGIDRVISEDGAISPSLPSVYIRRKQVRHGERMDVERSMEALAQWVYKNGIAPEGTPILAFAYPYLRNEMRPPQERAQEEAVCRVLYELLEDGRDSDSTRAIRALAHDAFNMAGALDALAERVVRENPDVEREAQQWLAASRPIVTCGCTAPTSFAVPTALWIAMDEARSVALFLRQLDAKIRSRVLFAPYDQAPRGARPEQVLFLAAIKDLERAGFTEEEIAELIDDGYGGTVASRARRVQSNLDRDKQRDRRTKLIGPARTVDPPPGAHSQV